MYVAGLLMCTIRGPVWGLYTYVAVFYLHPPSRWWGAYLPEVRWSFVAAAVTMVCVILRKRDTSRPSFWSYGLVWIFAAYVAYMWLQTPWAADHDVHRRGAILFTKYLLLLYLIYEILVTKEQVRDFLLLHVAGCFYLGWLAFNLAEGGRLEGVGGPGIDDANTMSMQFGTGVIIAAMLLMSEKRYRIFVLLAFLPFILNGMVLGNSRGAFVGLLAGGLCLYWLRPAVYKRQFMIFAVLGVVLFGMLATDFVWRRISSLEAVTSEDEELDFSARSRIGIAKAQWQMFLDHPFGAGHEGTTVLSPDYLSAKYLADTETGASRSSHNTVMGVVVNQGIVGIILLVALFIWVRKSIRFSIGRFKNDSAAASYVAAVAAALTVAFVAGQFSPYLKAEIQYWLLGLLLCVNALALKTDNPDDSSANLLPQK